MAEVPVLLLQVVGAAATLTGGLWALTRYVVEKGVGPTAEFDVECDTVGTADQSRILEITLHITNRGSSVLVVGDIRLILKYICENEPLQNYRDKNKMGRLRFPHSLSRELTGKGKDDTGFSLLPYDTFVQPGVHQKYSFVTAITRRAEFVHLHAQYSYTDKTGPVRAFLLRLSHLLGLVRYSLRHIDRPHTIQRCFKVKQNV